MGLRIFGHRRQLSHAELRAKLSEYLDRQLPPEQIAQVELHLPGCEGCSAELGALRATQQILHGLPPVRLPRSFAIAAVPRPAPLPRAFYWLRTATATAAAAFLLLLAAPMLLPTAEVPTATSALQPAQVMTRAAPRDQVAAPQPGAAASDRRLGATPEGAEKLAAPAAAPAASGPAATVPMAAAAAPRAAKPEPDEAGAAGAQAAAPVAPMAAPVQEAAPGASREQDSVYTRSAPLGPVAPPAAAPSELPPAVSGSSVQADEPVGQRQSAASSAAPPLQTLQVAVAGLATLFGLATGGLWWGHRRQKR